jgi:putative transport protein
VTEVAEFLTHNELFLLFAVVLLGVGLGRLPIFGVRLGAAGVLFAGLALSAVFAPGGHTLNLTPILRDFGLLLFVYCVGLAGGPGFFRAWRERGVRFNVSVVLAFVLASGVTLLGARLLEIDRAYATGIFCGALTSTPALAAAAERVQGTLLAQAPAIGYSVAYPFGVLGGILMLRLHAAWRRRQLAAERAAAPSSATVALVNGDFRVTRPELLDKAIGELRVRETAGVVISRLRRAGAEVIPTKYTVLHRGDTVVAVGAPDAIAQAEAYFGERSDERLEAQRSRIDIRRILVSKKEHAGRRIADLELDRRFGAQVTRLRRADFDMLPSPELRLELGDRIRVVAPVERLGEISTFFGDSERDLAHLDLPALALGLCLGLLLARVPFPGPGGVVTLGVAGGPLIVALILGRLGRTGSFVWQIPYEASSTLREIGLTLFLAGVGVSAGSKLVGVPTDSLFNMLALGATLTVTTSAVALAALHYWAKASAIGALGALSGMQTQSATLAVAHDLSGRSEDTWVAYALVYPVAMIGKIIAAQLLIML